MIREAAGGPFRKIDTTANGKGDRYAESSFYPIVTRLTRARYVRPPPRALLEYRNRDETCERLHA